MTKTRLTLIGGGNMGFSLLQAWETDNVVDQLCLVEPDTTLHGRAQKLGIKVFASADAFLDVSPQDIGGTSEADEIIVFAVKPQILAKAAPAYDLSQLQRARMEPGNVLYISIAAGVTLETLGGLLGPGAAIVRAMPNMPAMIRAAMTVAVPSRDLSANHRAVTTRLFEAAGALAWLDDEALIDVATAISGSGPAYLFHFLECMIAAAETLGLEAPLAQQLSVHTLLGASQMAAQGDESAADLRRLITSPKGTTEAALEIFMGKRELLDLVTRAAQAAHTRACALRQASTDTPSPGADTPN